MLTTTATFTLALQMVAQYVPFALRGLPADVDQAELAEAYTDAAELLARLERYAPASAVPFVAAASVTMLADFRRRTAGNGDVDQDDATAADQARNTETVTPAGASAVLVVAR